MKAIVISSPGGPEVLEYQEVEDPEIKDDEVLIKVCATALNRADTLQRKGKYPPPPGASSLLGLECSGTVEAVGRLVSRWKVGDQVCALLAGGGYAEKVALPEVQILPVPPGISLQDAAALPEVACTVWSTVFMTSRLSPGSRWLKWNWHLRHPDSQVSSMQSLHHIWSSSRIRTSNSTSDAYISSPGSDEKGAACKSLGADVTINYKTEDFVARVKEETNGKGVDVILDSIGAAYFQKNLECLSLDGRLFLIGFMSGAVTEFNMASLFSKRLSIQGAGLRSRSVEKKAEIVKEVEEKVWPAIGEGKVKPVIYKVFPLAEAAQAHMLMESSIHVGKILLLP